MWGESDIASLWRLGENRVSMKGFKLMSPTIAGYLQPPLLSNIP
jgi:hypothetical protein